MAPARRRFDPITVPAERGFRRVHRITCGCGFSDDQSANTWCGARAHEDLARVWTRKGWSIGSSPSRDICPNCQRAKRERIKQVSKPENVVPLSPAKADPPREMSREDRRVIFAKLDEVYIDEKTGYAAGWSDQRLAEDLGVPWAWVKTVRDENFGPAIDETVAGKLAQAKDIADQFAKCERSLNSAVAAAIDDAKATSAALHSAAAPILKSLAEIERALGLRKSG